MKQLLILSSLLLLIACGNRTRKGSDIDTFMLDGPGSVYIPEDEMLDEATVSAIKTMVAARVEEVYEEVNRRWDPDYLSKQSDRTLEDMFTTRRWRKVYNDVRDLERTFTDSDERHFFVEGGNTWTMGSFDAPFKVSDLVVNPTSKCTAEARFWICPAESEGSEVVWVMEIEDGEWRIDNFIDDTPDHDSGESERFDYLEHMEAYIEANS